MKGRAALLAGLALAPALALAACDAKRAAADGYDFGKAEWDRPDMTIRFVEHRSPADMRAAAPKGTIERAKAEGREVMAWSSIEPAKGLCVVHIVDPAVAYAPEWIGHEVTHCIKGRWHA